MDLRTIFDQIDIEQGDKILVNSSIVKLMIELKKNSKKFDANLVIDSLINKIGPSGTLMFPTFNWDYCKGEDFDYY